MLLVLLGPGVLLHALLSPRARAVELPLYAAAFWVVGFWWLRLLPCRAWEVRRFGTAMTLPSRFLLPAGGAGRGVLGEREVW